VLTSHPDIEKDPGGGYVWVDREGEGKEPLGTFVMGAGRLVFHADSEELAQRGRRMIEGVAGAAIRHAGIQVEEIEDADGDEEPSGGVTGCVTPLVDRAGGEGMSDAEAAHGRRRVPVDWDELELAFEWQSDEQENYLDLRTGHVVVKSSFGAPDEEGELSEEELETGLAEGHLVHIERLPSSRAYDWMADFAASIGDSWLRERLDRALHGRGAFRRFKDELADRPREREQWFAIRDARLREAMLEWLADNDIEPTTEPPRRAG
jgi:hypothetical protein